MAEDSAAVFDPALVDTVLSLADGLPNGSRPASTSPTSAAAAAMRSTSWPGAYPAYTVSTMHRAKLGPRRAQASAGRARSRGDPRAFGSDRRLPLTESTPTGSLTTVPARDHGCGPSPGLLGDDAILTVHRLKVMVSLPSL